MRPEDLDRILSRVHIEPNTGCWLWVGTAPDGYGRTRVEGRSVLVHRVVYEHHHGPVSADLDLDHKCRTTQCCNPDHLEPVTHRENMRRGEGFAGKNARRTHCNRGHALTPDNLVQDVGRRCKTCHGLRRLIRGMIAEREWQLEQEYAPETEMETSP